MNQRSIIRRAAASTVVVPAVLLAAACGSADPAPATPSQTQSAAATETGGETATSSAPTSAAPVADGKVDKAAFISKLKAGTANATTAHVAMDIGGAGQSITMSGDTKLDASNPSMQMKMKMQGMNLQMLLIDKKVYLKGLPNLPAGKWASFDEKSEVGKQMSRAATQADPKRMYDQFENGLTKVEKIGSETVDGESMTKYALTLDSKKALGSATASTAGAASLPKTIDYTAWVDAKDHLRKVSFDVSGVKATVNMSKYGEPVDITAPAAKDVVKVPGT